MDTAGLFISAYLVSLLAVGLLALFVVGEDGGPLTLIALLGLPALIASGVVYFNLNKETQVVCTATGINRLEELLLTEDCGQLSVSTKTVDIDDVPIGRPLTLTITGTDSTGKVVRDVS